MANVKTLFIDLASADQMFAVTSEGRVIASRPIDDAKAEEQLMPTLDSLLRESGSTYEDLKRIAVVLGPGGFMSLRVGVSMANALSYALNIPSAGIHASDLWLARIDSLPRSSDSGIATAGVWLHSTKKTHLFVRGFGPLAEKWPQPQLIELEGLKRLLPPSTNYVGELIPEHIDALHLAQQSGTKSIQEVLPAVLTSLPYELNQTLLPWYGREG